MVDDKKIKDIEEMKEPEFHLLFVNSELSDGEEEKKINEIITKRNLILSSLGFSFDNNGSILPRNSQMFDGLIGFVVGDALGVPVEFSNRDYMKEKPLKDMVGYCYYDVPEGTWSDDTSMMLATMDSIIQVGGIDYYDIMYKFSEWIDYAKYTATDKVFDIGSTTRKAILKFKRHDPPIECGGFDLKDNGNGSLMRMLPVAYYLSQNEFSEDEEVNIIDNISSLTHAHEISCLGCKIYCDYVNKLLNGVDKINALNSLKKQDYVKYYSSITVDEYYRILNGNILKLSRDEINSSGYVVDTLEASLWCVLNTNNYEDAVLTAINLGGDTDTIGAITGSLAGIIYGREQIPDRWLNKIKKLGYVESLCDEFVNFLKGVIWHKYK